MAEEQQTGWLERASDGVLKGLADTGLRGQGAVVESMRRLRESIGRNHVAETRLGNRILWLSVIMVVLIVVQVVVAIIEVSTGP